MEAVLTRKRIRLQVVTLVKNLPSVWFGAALGFALIKARFETETYIDFFFPTYNGYNAPFVGIIIFYSTVMALFALLLDLVVNKTERIKWNKQKLFVTGLLILIPSL